MATQPIFRKAEIPDAGVIADIHCRAWTAAYSGILPPDFIAARNAERRTAWERLLSKAHDNHLAVLKEQPVGFFSLFSPCRDADAPEAGEVGALYLAPEFQGRGIGTRMLDAAVLTLHGRGHEIVVVWVLEKNFRARRIYERYGFSPDGATRQFTPDLQVVEIRYRIDRRHP